MKHRTCIALLVAIVLTWLTPAVSQPPRRAIDLRGVWVGSAKGSIFGAEGHVNVVQQKGDRIYGIVEGGNIFGKARFEIRGQVRGNMIYGEKAGNVFQGYLYPDGAIRGVMRTVDGDKYRIMLRRSQPFWNPYMPPGW